jgi:hypothetical protein
MATLLIGATAVAADGPHGKSHGKKAAPTAAAPEVAGIPEFPEGAAPGSAQKPDTSADAAAEAKGAAAATAAEQAAGAQPAADAKPAKSGDVESEVLVEGKQETHCRSVLVTGTRLRKQVCTTAVQADANKANDKYQENQAKDYLRRMSEQATIAQPAGPYIQSGLP